MKDLTPPNIQKLTIPEGVSQQHPETSVGNMKMVNIISDVNHKVTQNNHTQEPTHRKD